MHVNIKRSSRISAAVLAGTAVVLASAVAGVPASAAPSASVVHNATAATPDPWPVAGFNGGHTNYNPNERRLVPSTVKRLTQKWALATDDPYAVGGNSIFQVTQGGYTRYSMTNGHKQRFYRAGNNYHVPSALVVAGSRLILQVDSNLEAVAVSTGKVLWTLKTAGNTGAVSHVFSPMTVSGATIYAIEDTANSSAQTSAYKLVAISTATGKVLWSQPNLRGPIAVGDGNVYAAGVGDQIGINDFDVTIVALKAATGASVWAPYQLSKGQVMSSLVASGATVFAGGGGFEGGSDVYAVSAVTGTLNWAYTSKNTQGEPTAQSPVTDGKTYAYLNDGGTVVALNAATGGLLWRRSSGYTMTGGGGVVYTGLKAYQLSTGKPLWTGNKKKYDVVYSAMVADGHMIADASMADGGGGPYPTAFGLK